MSGQTQNRVFVDCQVLQYLAWNRGMGRYTLKLLEALDKADVDLTLIFNQEIHTDPERFKIINEACPAAKTLFLKLSSNPNLAGGWQKLQQICASELDNQLKNVVDASDTYLIASNFALRYCSTFPTIACKKAIIFYDLTPYLAWSEYKNTPDFESKKYFTQLKDLFEADQLWAISESAANQAKYWLGIDGRKVSNIRGASIRNLKDNIHKPKSMTAKARFILCPSADGPHKNNQNMVSAFADFNRGVKNKYKLVITSSFSESSQQSLQSISEDVIFCGHVSDGELGWLYENCDAVLFVSKTEGLGLPVLEAVGASKKVVCSDIDVFKEISADAFYFADPDSVTSIAEALSDALVMSKDWDKKKSGYKQVGLDFSWPNVARSCLELIKAPLTPNPKPSPHRQEVWYADSDKRSLARDLAETLYPMDRSKNFVTMRSFDFKHVYPSYLLEMGAARHALDGHQVSENSQRIYLIDDSPEAAYLLLQALQFPGWLIFTYPENHQPKAMARYLDSNFGDDLSYPTLIKLTKKAGNHLLFLDKLAKRGTQAFIEETASLNRQLAEGSIN